MASDIIWAVSVSAQVQVLGHAPSLADAHAVLLSVRPEILLIDLLLPDGDGTTLAASGPFPPARLEPLHRVEPFYIGG